MDRFFDLLFRVRAPAVAALALLTLYAAAQLPRLDYDISFKPLYVSNDPVVADNAHFVRVFDNVNNMLLMVVEGDIFAPRLIQRLTEVTRKLEAIEQVDEVYSLVNTPFIEPTPEGFEVQPLARLAGMNQESMEAIAAAYPLYRNRLLSADGERTGIFVQLRDDYVDASTERERSVLLECIEGLVQEAIPDGYRLSIMGTRILERDYSDMMHRDEAIFFSIGFLINVLLLIWTLRRWAYVGLALSATTLALVISFGLVTAAGYRIDILSTQMTPLIMVITTAQVIHFLFGYLHALEQGRTYRSAVRSTLRRVGWGNLLASLTTAIGFVSLQAASVTSIEEFGLKMAISVVVIYLVVQTLLPFALMHMYVPQRAELRRVGASPWVDGLLESTLHLAVAHPGRILLLVVACYGAAFWALTRLEINNFAMGEVAADHPLQVAVRETDKLSGFTGFEISVRSEGESLLEPDMLRRVEALQRRLTDEAGVITAWSVVDYLKEMEYASADGVNRPRERVLPGSREAAAQYLLLYAFNEKANRELSSLISPDRHWLRIVGRVHDVGANRYLELQRIVEREGRRLFGNSVEVKVLGEPLLVFRGLARIVDDLVISFSTALVLIVALLLLALRSVRLGLVSILPNLTPILLTAGIMGVAGIPLRVGTVIFFSIAIAIAVDDTIHYLVRYRQERRNGASSAEAIANTHHHTGRAVVYTSVIMACGFLATLPSEFMTLRDMAIINASSISLAMFADLLFIPWLLTLLTERKELPQGLAQES